MTHYTMREVHGEELLDTAFLLTHYAFYETSEFKRSEWQDRLPYFEDRHFVVTFDGSKPIATTNNLHMSQCVRDKVYPMGGIAGVAVDPYYRRQGLARDVIIQCYKQAYEVGEVLSSLYPFKESFYGRAGYVSYPQLRLAHFDPGSLAPLLKNDIPGEVELIDMKDGFEIYDRFIAEMQPTTHGMAYRTGFSKYMYRDFAHRWLLIARHEDEVVGVMSYKLEGLGKGMDIHRFYYKNGIGKYLMLAWIGRHDRQAYRAHMFMHPSDYLETWLTDLDVTVETPQLQNSLSPAPMGRVLDVEKLSGMRVGTGQFTAKIEDAYCGWNNRAFQFEGVDGKLVVSTRPSADCTLSINALSGLVYGVISGDDIVPRGWGNPDKATTEAMFPRQVPFIHEYF